MKCLKNDFILLSTRSKLKILMSLNPNIIDWNRLNKKVFDYYRVPELREYLKGFRILYGEKITGISSMKRDKLIIELSRYRNIESDASEERDTTVSEKRNLPEQRKITESESSKIKEGTSVNNLFSLPNDIEEKTVTTRRGEISYNGYNLEELISWIQKSIRRGNVDHAVWSMVEIITMPKREIISNLFNRLRIIALEDIGVADPEVVIYLHDSLNQVTVPDSGLKRKPKLPITEIDIQLIANTIAKMAKGRHIRSASDFNAAYLKSDLILEDLFNLFPQFYTDKQRERYQDGKRYADSLDILTEKMKILLFNGDYDAGFYLKRLLKLADDDRKSDVKRYNSSKLRYFILSEIFDVAKKKGINKVDQYEKILVQWYKQGLEMMREKDLPIIFMVLMILDQDKITGCSEKSKSEIREHIVINNFKEGRSILEIPDYAIDKHTARGKREGKGSMDFVHEGALVVNEPIELLNIIMRQIYIDSKIVELKNNGYNKWKLEVIEEQVNIHERSKK